MPVKTLLTDMGLTMLTVFVSAAVVTALYSLLVHGSGQVDWGTAVRLAVILGLALPLNKKFGSRS